MSPTAWNGCNIAVNTPVMDIKHEVLGGVPGPDKIVRDGVVRHRAEQNEMDQDATLTCVGKFNQKGIPQITSPHLGLQAMVTFQTITLHQMMSQMIHNEALQSARIRHKDGSVIRVDRQPEGFIAYLERV